MDFRELLSVADCNKAEAKSAAAIKRYSTSFAPPKKVAKPGVTPKGVEMFLQRKKAEEERKAAEARKKKEELLSIRAQSTKNNKKAKIMASRTKDNDFSKIRLTEDQIEAKKKRETELQRQNLTNIAERMKARIKMEEFEQTLPRKRKRKHKQGEPDDGSVEPENEVHQVPDPPQKSGQSNQREKSSSKPIKPAKPPMSYHDLLNAAKTIQHEPVKLKVAKKAEEKLFTKKERKIYLEEQERLRKKEEALKRGILPSTKRKIPDSSQTKVPVSKQKDSGDMKGNAKLSKEQSTVKVNKNNEKKVLNQRPSATNPESSKKPTTSKERPIQHKAVPKKEPMVEQPKQKAPTLDEDMITAIEKRIREKIEKEMEQKLLARFGLENKPASSTSDNKAQSESIHRKKVTEAPKNNPILASKQKAPEPYQKKKVPFHINPYLEPPRRLLESQRPNKPQPKRRIESDDEDDEMSDFIDDTTAQNEDDYSKHIRDIFGYDRNRYIDDDDDDIVESSFVEQMKEEKQSAKIGLLEDLEDMRKEKEEEMRKKKKQKLKNR